MNQETGDIQIVPAESKKFREICELYDQPDFLRKSFVRFMGEYCHVMKLKPKWLNPKFKEAIQKVRPAFGFRRLILMAWRKTVLKKHIHLDKRKDSPYMNCGRAIGSLQNINYTDAKLYCPDDDALWKAVFAPFEDIPEEIKKRIQDEQEKLVNSIDRAFELATALPPQRQADFWAGYAEGQSGPFSEKLGFTDAKDNTKIYHFLLMLGDLVRRFDSVENSTNSSNFA